MLIIDFKRTGIRVACAIRRINALDDFLIRKLVEIHFSYIDRETLSEEYVAIPEQGGDKLIPECMANQDHLSVILY